MEIPNWRNLLEESLKKNESEPALNYVQLGTIKPYGKPTSRTVHFQSFFNKHPTEKDNKFVSTLMFFIDVRTIDVQDILDGSPYGEVCMFLPITHEIFRLSGKLYLICSPNSSIYSKIDFKNKIFSKFGYNMEKERLNQWKEYLLPIQTNIPDKFKEVKKVNEKDSPEKKENHFMEEENVNNNTKSKLYYIENESEDDNYLSINPRHVMVDDYLNYQNLSHGKIIQRKEKYLNDRDDYLFADTSDTSADYNDSDTSIKSYKDGMAISKQMDFRPNRHYYRSPHKHCHHSMSSLSSKSSEESNSDYYYHSDCELCKKIVDEKKKGRRSYSLSMKDQKREIVDNFCLLLLDADRVCYSNFDYTPLKIFEYTRSYSIQEDTANNMYLNHHDDDNTKNCPLTLSNTYTSIDFDNLKNVKSLSSNRLLDSAPLVSSPAIPNEKKEEKQTTKQEEWDCTVVNYALLT